MNITYDENDNPSITGIIIKQIVSKDDEYTMQVIKDYVRKKYPNEIVKIDFYDEKIINEVIELGILEYKKRHFKENRI